MLEQLIAIVAPRPTSDRVALLADIITTAGELIGANPDSDGDLERLIDLTYDAYLRLAPARNPQWVRLVESLIFTEHLLPQMVDAYLAQK